MLSDNENQDRLRIPPATKVTGILLKGLENNGSKITVRK